MIRAVSLDFWGTIAVFNPAYAAARTSYFALLFGLPEDEAHTRYQFIKRGYDYEAETTGSAVTPLVAIKRLLAGQFLNKNAVEVLADLENIVRKFPPLLHPEIIPLIIKLQERGIIMGVSSNTNFIAGRLVQEIFNIPWDFAVYSDIIGVSKPDPDFFRTVLKQCKNLGVEDSIVHIGDNSVCDIEGAESVGMRGILTNGPEQTIAILKGDY